MVYVDTSVLVPLFLHEPASAAVARWYEDEHRNLVCAAWCVPEFASALGIKQRKGGIDTTQAHGAWTRFERMVAADLHLLPVGAADFQRAAELVLDATHGLRAGDALHLACAESAGARHIATLDQVLCRNAQRLEIMPIVLRDKD